MTDFLEELEAKANKPRTSVEVLMAWELGLVPKNQKWVKVKEKTKHDSF